MKIRPDLKIYLAVLFAAPLASASVNAAVALRTARFSVGFGIALAYGVFAALFLIDTAAALAVRYLTPRKLLDPALRVFRVSEREVRFYRRLRIRRWVHLVPEMGQLAHFKKDRLYDNSPAYLARFLSETVYAEVMHVWSILLSPLPIFLTFLLAGEPYLFCTLPLCLVNVLLQLPPVFIQRYNRPLFARYLARQTRRAAK